MHLALCRAKKNLIINDALFFLLASRFMSYSFERLELTSECSEAACVKCGALTNNMLAEDQPCVSVVQQKVCIRIDNLFATVSPSFRYEWQPPLSGKGVLFVHSVPAGLSHKKRSFPNWMS